MARLGSRMDGRRLSARHPRPARGATLARGGRVSANTALAQLRSLALDELDDTFHAAPAARNH